MRTARTALRTSIVTAALAGAMLVPATGSAFAVSGPLSDDTAAASSASDNSRYEGRPVLVGEGMIAVLRNGTEGPEAWIRAVGADWKPGDPYLTRVLGTLDRGHLTASANGAGFELTKAETDSPVLVVTKGGKSTSYALPKGAPTTPDSCVAAVTKLNLGAGVLADLSMSPKGPKAVMYTDPAGTWTQTLTRTSPQIAEPYYARIANPSGAKPVFEWKTQGGSGVPVSALPFPALPKGCALEYQVKEDAATPTASATPKPAASTAPKAQTAGQTSVVPKGGVAAGAEIAAADTDNSTTVAAGAGLMAVFGALGASVFLRRRRAQG
ncbi:hypothetical protein [Streptomyces sp. NPDC091371]|uniref:hypothetical protein n=1 Tax=Streptomyces sp. NPDC091371 TaxID=3155303 RepID=UPI003447ECF9